MRWRVKVRERESGSETERGRELESGIESEIENSRESMREVKRECTEKGKGTSKLGKNEKEGRKKNERNKSVKEKKKNEGGCLAGGQARWPVRRYTAGEG